MNISQMHVWFRQYAQQMGMQNVRAILPEQIDLLINTSITDTINQLIQQNIGLTNDRVITDNSKVSQINAFRTLYTVKEIPLLAWTVAIGGRDYNYSYFILDKESARIGKMTTKWQPNSMPGLTKTYFPDYLFLVDFSINYKKAAIGGGISGGDIGEYDDNAEVTNYFPVRLIDDAYLADTLNDFVLKPRLRSPIIVAYNAPYDITSNNIEDGKNESSNVVLDLYIDKFTEDTGDHYTLTNRLLPKNLRVSYIKKPAKVRYAEDIDGTNIDCDLPESMHVDILKHAVDLYRVSVNGSLYASQQQEQQQQRENTRNNYRNEGYGQNPQQQQQ